MKLRYCESASLNRFFNNYAWNLKPALLSRLDTPFTSPESVNRSYNKFACLFLSAFLFVQLEPILVSLTTSRFQIKHQIFHIQSQLAQSILNQC